MDEEIPIEYDIEICQENIDNLRTDIEGLIGELAQAQKALNLELDKLTEYEYIKSNRDADRKV